MFRSFVLKEKMFLTPFMSDYKEASDFDTLNIGIKKWYLIKSKLFICMLIEIPQNFN